MVTQLGGHGRPAAGRHRGAPPKPGVSSVAPTPVFPASQALDIAVDGHSWWLLEGGALARLDGGVVGTTPLTGLRLPLTSTPLLAVDAAARRVWVVVANTSPSRMVEFDANTMQRLREVRWPQLVHGAVGYRGHLYLSTDLGVADLAPGAAQPQVVAGLSGAVGPIALDPSRHRLIAMDLGYPTSVWTYRPGGRPVESPTSLDFRDGSLAVAAGRIWVAGTGAGGPVLERLDPRRLRPDVYASATLPGSLLGGGVHVFWLRSGDTLACMSAGRGRVEQRWPLPDAAAVASLPGTGLVATSNGLLTLVLTRCAG